MERKQDSGLASQRARWQESRVDSVRRSRRFERGVSTCGFCDFPHCLLPPLSTCAKSYCTREGQKLTAAALTRTLSVTSIVYARWAYSMHTRARNSAIVELLHPIAALSVCSSSSSCWTSKPTCRLLLVFSSRLRNETKTKSSIRMLEKIIWNSLNARGLKQNQRFQRMLILINQCSMCTNCVCVCVYTDWFCRFDLNQGLHLRWEMSFES